VVGINSAYLDGFSGGTLGIAAYNLVPLIEKAAHPAAVSSAKLSSAEIR
jgi:hypothetical protein